MRGVQQRIEREQPADTRQLPKTPRFSTFRATQSGGVALDSVSRRSMLGGLVVGAAAAGAGTLVGTEAAQAESNRAPSHRQGGKIREYWLQIDHLRHDLAPTKFDPMMGTPITSRTMMDALVYRAFSPHWGHLLPGTAALGPNNGFPGPVIRGEIGDTIIVHLRNNDTFYKQPHSLHVHGIKYDGDNDGAWTSDRRHPGAAIPVGGSFTYTYQCVESSLGTCRITTIPSRF
jgi:manganese oxidase